MLVTSLAGLDKIEFLQNHENQEIYLKAYEIINRYFGTDEPEDTAVPPPSLDPTNQQYQFDADGKNPPPAGGFEF